MMKQHDNKSPMQLRRSEYDGRRRAESTSWLCIASRFVVKSKCQEDQLLGLQRRIDLSPFSDSIAPFRFGGWLANHQCGQKKSVSAISHLWVNPQLLEKLTHMCCFFQDNGRQTVFVTYKQQCWSPSFDRYFASHSIFN